MGVDFVVVWVRTTRHAFESGKIREIGIIALLGAGVVVVCSVGLDIGRTGEGTTSQAGH